MRIVHVSDYYMPQLGYQESILPKYHARHGHEVHVITSDRYAKVPHYDSSWRPLLGPRFLGAKTETSHAVTVHRLPGSMEHRNRILLRGLHAELQFIRPDVIFGHGTTNYTAFQLARSARKLATPLFLDCHMLFTVQDKSNLGRIFYRTLRTATSKLLTPHVNRFFGVAEEACDFLHRAQGIPRDKIQLLPLGLDTDVFSPRPVEASSLRSGLGINENAILVMQTGKLTPDKAPHLLSAAIAPLMLSDPRVHLVFVGGGSPEYMDAIFRPFTRAEARSRVHQVPLVSAKMLSSYFSAADIVVFPGGSSLSCIEAAGCSATVVMTDLPAGRSRADNGLGVTFPDGDVEQLRGLLRTLMHDRGKRLSVGEIAYTSVVQTLSYDSIARRLETHMSGAASSSRDSI